MWVCSFVAMILVGCGGTTKSSTTTTKQRSAVELATAEACHCVGRQNLDKTNGKQKNLRLGLCIMGAAGKYPGTTEALGINMKKPGAAQELGEKMGLQMGLMCPNVLANAIEDRRRTSSRN